MKTKETEYAVVGVKRSIVQLVRVAKSNDTYVPTVCLKRFSMGILFSALFVGCKALSRDLFGCVYTGLQQSQPFCGVCKLTYLCIVIKVDSLCHNILLNVLEVPTFYGKQYLLFIWEILTADD